MGIALTTALRTAIVRDDAADVRQLLAAGADQNARDDFHAFTPLMLAVFTRAQAVCEVLLAHGINPNDFDAKAAYSPLMWAVIAGDQALAELLLAYGADTRATTEMKVTAMSLARQCRQPAMERWLIQHGAEVGGRWSNTLWGVIDSIEQRVTEIHSRFSAMEYRHAVRTVKPHPFYMAFRQRRVVLPVIHVESADQALRNVAIAVQCGADGVFLINHGIAHMRLFEITADVRYAYPDLWIGVNTLDLAPRTVFAHLSADIQGLWVDNAGIDERTTRQTVADAVIDAREASGWTGLYFGGVAFKYQRAVEDVRRAAYLAGCYMDVVTTSGPGTGKAAEEEKIGAMATALHPVPLAIASGVTPENVEAYLPWADCFLVATGISQSFYDLDPARTAALVRQVHAYLPKTQLDHMGKAYLPED